MFFVHSLVVVLLLATVAKSDFWINSMSDFHTMQELSKGMVLTDTYHLMCDLDFTGVEAVPIGQPHTGSGTSYPFCGVFDGHGHSVNNISMDLTHKSCSDAGFFYALGNATIQNLHIGKTCHFRGAWAGALSVKLKPAFNFVSVTIKNVSNSAKVIGGGLAGGLLGCSRQYGSDSDVTFIDCWNDGNISVPQRSETGSLMFSSAGGLCGIVSGNATFINCHNYGPVYSELKDGTVSHATSAGGIVGQFGPYAGSNPTKLVLQSCTNNGTITSYFPSTATGQNNTAAAGGIIGSFNRISESNVYTLIIDSCINDGTVSAYSDHVGTPVYSGGVMGLARLDYSGMHVSISECLNSGNVSSGSSTSGSILASGISCIDSTFDNAELDNCFNEGNVSSKQRAYGIVNNAGSADQVVNTGDVSGGTASYGIAEVVRQFDFVVNAGDMVCKSGTTCTCGISPVSNDEDEYHKETGGCQQNGGTRLITDENGYLVVDIPGAPFLADYLNEDSTQTTNNGMMWTRDMRLGYLVSFEFCQTTPAGNEHVIASPKESLETSILREGDNFKEVLHEDKYRTKLNGAFFYLNNSVSKACTMVAHEVNGCVMYDCSNDYSEINPTALTPCINCDACHYGTCNLTNGICDYSRRDGWQQLASQENECYELKCSGNEWIIAQKEEAAQWIDGSNECEKHFCDNSSGLYYAYSKGINKCNVTNKPCYNYICRQIGDVFECGYEKVPGWDKYFIAQNECFEITCIGDQWGLKQRDHVTEWKKHSDGCIEYVCDNDTGVGQDNRCWSSETVRRVCENGKCTSTVRDLNTSTIELVLDGLNLTDFNMTEFEEELRELFGITKPITITWESLVTGEVVVYISLDAEDEDVARQIASEALRCLEIFNKQKSEGLNDLRLSEL